LNIQNVGKDWALNLSSKMNGFNIVDNKEETKELFVNHLALKNDDCFKYDIFIHVTDYRKIEEQKVYQLFFEDIMGKKYYQELSIIVCGKPGDGNAPLEVVCNSSEPRAVDSNQKVEFAMK